MKNSILNRFLNWLGFQELVYPSQEVEFRPQRTPPTRVLLAPAQMLNSSQAQRPVPNSLSENPDQAPPPPLPGQVFYQRYFVQTSRELSHTVYYEAVDMICEHCKMRHVEFPPDGVCLRCHRPLHPVLIHECPPAIEPLDQVVVRALMRVGRSEICGLLPHRALLPLSQQALYTIVKHPGRWGVIVHGKRSLDETVAIVAQMGQILSRLHRSGLVYTGYSESLSALLESWVIAAGGSDIYLADLSSCALLQSDQVGQRQVARDMKFLGHALSALTSKNQRISQEQGKEFPEIQNIIHQASQGGYATTAALRHDLSQVPQTPVRSLKQHCGQASHLGQNYTRNEDTVLTLLFDQSQHGHAVPIGLYLVADGMGGHEAGDVASQIVYRVIAEWVLQSRVLPDLRRITRKLTADNTPAQILTRAIQRANTALLQHAEAHQRDLGSTVTAALVIGDVVTVANVGDSRTYVLRRGELRQITEDHSLVARLVDAHVIKASEARTHPQRNEIYRSLGHEKTVEIDTYTLPLHHGDHLILCSDGLWDMVYDDALQHIVEVAQTPQQACDDLVRAANHAGGDDNISVIVVEMT
jgi:serine/threonine protein phosphatase PrpC